MALIIRVWRINGGERREKGRDDLCLKRLKDLQLFAAEEVEAVTALKTCRMTTIRNTCNR